MSNILSQEEIDTLLGGLTGGAVKTVEEGALNANRDAEVVKFDFFNQDRIVRGGMPTLEVIHDRFARLLRTGLTQAVRRAVEVNILTYTEIKYGEFIRTISKPSSLHMLKFEPLRGYALLVLPGCNDSNGKVATTAEATKTAAEPFTGTVHEVKMRGTVAPTPAFFFEPAELTIKQGDKIKFTMVDGGPHNVSFNSPMPGLTKIPDGATALENR